MWYAYVEEALTILQIDGASAETKHKKENDDVSVWAIADLHLSLSTDKPMDVFGPGWQNYVARLEEAWRRFVALEDTVLIPGDISWGISMEEALADLEFLESLPGTKILSKGNHDYWWGTNKKVEDFLLAHGLTSMKVLKNNGFVVENVLVAGSRGWLLPENPESKEADEKVYVREVARLERSLQDAVNQWDGVNPDAVKAPENLRRVAMLHYPPVYDPDRSNGFTEVLEKYGIDLCIYGHLHGRGHQKAYNGVKNGVKYQLVAADFLKFEPVKIS